MTAEQSQAGVQSVVDLNHPAPLSGSGSKVRELAEDLMLFSLEKCSFQCLTWHQESSGGTLDMGLE